MPVKYENMPMPSPYMRWEFRRNSLIIALYDSRDISHTCRSAPYNIVDAAEQLGLHITRAYSFIILRITDHLFDRRLWRAAIYIFIGHDHIWMVFMITRPRSRISSSIFSRHIDRLSSVSHDRRRAHCDNSVRRRRVSCNPTVTISVGDSWH